jgi:hypothetical protein
VYYEFKDVVSFLELQKRATKHQIMWLSSQMKKQGSHGGLLWLPDA